MKATILTIALAIAMALASTSTTPSSSWETYCEKYNVDSVNPTPDQENYYLDCYVGSVEEEEDMSK